MHGGIRLALASLLSVALALGITWVEGTIPLSPDSKVLPVFQMKAKRLTNDNLVDKLGNLPLRLAIAKVDWQEPTLAIDLNVVPGLTQEDVYRDLLQLVRLGLKQTSNVDQVLIRVMQKPAPGATAASGRLLLSMDARRDRFRDRTAQSLAGDAMRVLLQQETDITYTGYWKDRFGG